MADVYGWSRVFTGEGMIYEMCHGNTPNLHNVTHRKYGFKLSLQMLEPEAFHTMCA